MDVVVGFSVTMTGTSSVVMENGEGFGSVADDETLVAVAGVLTAGVGGITVEGAVVAEDADGKAGLAMGLTVFMVVDVVVDAGVLTAAGEGLAWLNATPVSVGEDESLALTVLWSWPWSWPPSCAGDLGSSPERLGARAT